MAHVGLREFSTRQALSRSTTILLPHLNSKVQAKKPQQLEETQAKGMQNKNKPSSASGTGSLPEIYRANR